MKKRFRIIMRDLLLALGGFAILLFFFQHKLIWFPHHYGADYKSALPGTAVELRYSTSAGKQCSFYIPPAGAQVPDRLWVLFCGNGSKALDWADLVMRAPNKRDGFLLVEYPGYGFCEGSATPATIRESAAKAFTELAVHLKTTPAALDGKLNVLGHSIGCAAALEFAVLHPVRRVILVAPFTSLRDMARRTVGWPLCWLLRHNFDNRARLADLSSRPQPPRVTIFHGSADSVIPERMGQSLAGMFPAMASFHEVPGADHNSVVYDAEHEIFAAMND